MRRILIDGSMARQGGGLTYLVNIVPQLVAMAPNDRFRLLLRSERIARSIPPAPNLEIDLLPEANLLGRIRFTYHELPRLATRWGADLYFSAGESAPLRASCPMIASFRNAVPFAPPVGSTWGQLLRLRGLFELSRLTARVCQRIMFVSADSARWMGDMFRIPAARRAVIHHGIDATAWASRDPSVSIPYRSCILSVSSVHRHKNYVRLIEAYAALARRRPELPDLVIIGDVPAPDYLAEMRRARAASGVSEAIHLLSEVPYAEIKAYYACAELFVFPSFLETFGHPLLEAMASGVPVVAADIPVFREVAGDAACYADPHDTDALAKAMEEVLFTPSTRESLIARGREHVRGFGWEATARRLLALFDEVLSERVG